MNVDNNLLKKLEKLSYLEISEEKREETIAQLQSVLSFVENLAEVNTDNESTKFVMGTDATTLREDLKREPHDIATEILKNAPHSTEDSFIVPKIIE